MKWSRQVEYWSLALIGKLNQAECHEEKNRSKKLGCQGKMGKKVKCQEEGGLTDIRRRRQ